MNLGILIAIVTILVLVLIVVIAVLLNRGKHLKCPDCEHIFNAPVMEEKISGLGWTFPYAGRIKCPKCGKSRSRRDYDKPEPQQNGQ
jgi:ssDNA-binding Zn-finger/Zn-ribbon topoisomerase 1